MAALMSNRTLPISDSLYHYILSHSLREPEVLRQLRATTAALPDARMQIAPEQGQFMALLVELTGARQVLEIGTFTGYSALWMALAMPERGRLLACDLSREWTKLAARFWRDAGVLERIDLHIGPALDTLDRLLEDGATDRFDLAFVDADKENYPAYYERCLRLVRPGGLILFDNVLWDGAVADPQRTDPDTEAIRTLNRTLHRDQRISLSLVPIGDGLTLARRR
jgi:predicted O-methyltransferase YrrM